MKENSMRDIKIEKVVLNVGCGTKLKPALAKTMLEKISGKKAVITITRKRSTFNVPAKKPIGCKVTIRKNTDEFLKRLLEAKEMKLKESLERRDFLDNKKFEFINEEVNSVLKLLGLKVKI